MFQGCFKSVSSDFQECFRSVSRVFQEYFKSVSRVFQECFKSVSSEFQERFKNKQRCSNQAAAAYTMSQSMEIEIYDTKGIFLIS